MMKFKSIILSGLLLAGLGTVSTSCEDMFTAENSLVTDNLAPQDTVYQMMGIISQMQKLADRTVLLGEARADLVSYTSAASTDIQDIANNDISTDNAYNQPADYYAVINSCNIYLAYVDSTLETLGESYYGREITAAKVFRAWAYLELVKIYGEVPFVLEPITTASEATDLLEAFNSGNSSANMQTVCDYFISEIKPLASTAENQDLLPWYGSTTMRHYFIPPRVMLAELYLWRGSYTQNQNDFIEAARYYHDFFTFPDEEYVYGDNYSSSWSSPDGSFQRMTSTYFNLFTSSSTIGETIAYLPLDTAVYYGNYSELASIFNSTYSNNYYPSLSPSTRIEEISTSQEYCKAYGANNNSVNVVYAPTSNSENELYVGDLRLASIYYTRSMNSSTNSNYNSVRQSINKYSFLSDTRITYLPYYRKSILYLHMAEALNRGGFPETAFAVLKYGLSEEILSDTTIVSSDEYNRLSQISSVGFSGNFTTWDDDEFQTRWENNAAFLSTGTTTTTSTTYTIGIHSRGSGFAERDTTYYLPTDSTGLQTLPTLAAESTAEDTLNYATIAAANAAYLASDEVRAKRIVALEEIILEEEALEGVFEGTRFYDLMRYAMYYGEPTLLAEKVAQRNGKDNSDATLYSKLSNQSNWYLPLPTK